MLTLDVRVDVFEAASATFGQRLAPALDEIYTDLSDALRGCQAMAGSDEAGRSWAERYDPAAQQVAGLIAGLADGCTKLAGLLERTGFNHGWAESRSDPTRSVPTPPDRGRYEVVAGGNICLAGVPSAAGGSGGGPVGWSLVEHLVGRAWPNGHTATLRSAAAAWAHAADRLVDVASIVDIAVNAIATQVSPEVADATTTCQGMRGHILESAQACTGLAHSCGQLAGFIDQAHSALEHELASLAEWTAATEAAGALVGAVTFGGGELAAQGAESARIAKTAARALEILRAMSASVAALLDTIALTVARGAEVAARLRLILGATASRAVVAFAERIPADQRERGSIQIGRAVKAETEALDNLGRVAVVRNLGLGAATREEAMEGGRTWVGPGAHRIKNGTVWISKDGLRQFRVPSYKPKLGIWQANFESRPVPTGRWLNNWHLDIND